MVCVWGNKGWRMGNFINLECELFNPKHFQWGSKPKEFSRQIQVLPCDISLKHSKFIKKLLMHRQWQFIQVCLFKQSRVTGLTALCPVSALPIHPLRLGRGALHVPRWQRSHPELSVRTRTLCSQWHTRVWMAHVQMLANGNVSKYINEPKMYDTACWQTSTRSQGSWHNGVPTPPKRNLPFHGWHRDGAAATLVLHWEGCKRRGQVKPHPAPQTETLVLYPVQPLQEKDSWKETSWGRISIIPP